MRVRMIGDTKVIKNALKSADWKWNPLGLGWEKDLPISLPVAKDTLLSLGAAKKGCAVLEIGDFPAREIWRSKTYVGPPTAEVVGSCTACGSHGILTRTPGGLRCLECAREK